MASVHLTGPRVAVAAKPAALGGLRLPTPPLAVPTGRKARGLGLVVRAATVVSPKAAAQNTAVAIHGTSTLFGHALYVSVRNTYAVKSFTCKPVVQSPHNVAVSTGGSIAKYTSIKPLGDRVLVKVKTSEAKSEGGILLPVSVQTRPQGGEVVAVGEGRSFGSNTIEISVPVGAQVVYSKYAGTELEFNDTDHLILKEDDIIGILDGDDVKDLKPLNDRILIKVAEAEEQTAGGLLLTQAAKEKPSVGTVVAVGPGPLGEDGSRTPLSIAPGSNVLYSKYAGSEFKGEEGEYIVLRASDVLAVLS